MYNNGIRRRGASPARTCQHCGAAFYREPSKASPFCCAACRVAAGVPSRAVPPEDRFGCFVNQSGDCWLWTGAATGGRYGAFTGRDGAQVGAHVFAFESASGLSLPKGMLVCHTCDTPLCVRNDEPGVYVVNGIARPRFGHLWLGTPAENTADMNSKRRHTFGARHGRTVLTDDDVLVIRQRYANGETQTAIARDYSVTQEAVSAIVRRKSWQHI